MLNTVGAFCPHGMFDVSGAPGGPLHGLRFAVKDVIDIAGLPNGAGNPDWLRTHGAAPRTADAVQCLLDAGATCCGKTIADELCASMSGINPHYGTPGNVAAPRRLPGGSSSGSAAAVAAGQVDFALGTDTSGSVRLPASYCGIYGMRPTHGRVSMQGVVPLAPSFDTVGWLARDARTLAAVGAVMLARRANGEASAYVARQDDGFAPFISRPVDFLTRLRLLVATDVLGFVEPNVARAIIPLLRRLARHFGSTQSCALYGDDIGEWLHAHLTGVEDEFIREHRAWIEAVQPRFGPEVGARMVDLNPPPAAELQAATDARARIRARMSALLANDAILCMPTVPCVAPLRSASQDELTRTEVRGIVLGCVASLAGLPQVSCPWATADGAPVGLSLVAAAGCDTLLLEVAAILPWEK